MLSHACVSVAPVTTGATVTRDVRQRGRGATAPAGGRAKLPLWLRCSPRCIAAAPGSWREASSARRHDRLARRDRDRRTHDDLIDGRHHRHARTPQGNRRTAAIAGTATAVSNRVSRRQAGRWARHDAQQAAYADQAEAAGYAAERPRPPSPVRRQADTAREARGLEGARGAQRRGVRRRETAHPGHVTRRARSAGGARECGGDAEPGDELRDGPVVAVGDVVRADGGQRGVGGDPVPDLLPGLPAELLDRVVGVRVDGVQVVRGQLVEEGVVPVGVQRLEVALAGGEPLRGVQDVGPPLRGRLLGGVPAGDEPFDDVRRRGLQGRHRRFVGQPAGPDEQHPLVQAGQVPAEGLAEGADPVHRGERRGDGVDEERHRRHRVQPAEEDLQRLHHAVVDLHPQRHREVDPAVQRGLGQPLGDVPGDVERAWGGTEVADRGGREADAELRHQLVEEAVVVVRAEDDDQFRVVLGDELAGGGERGLDVRGQFSRRLRELQQRAVRHRARGRASW